MKAKTLMLVSFLSLLLASCNEFSESEEKVIKSGRLRNEAIASEFYDAFIDYWNNTINEEVEKTGESISDQITEKLSNSYMFFGDNIISDMYANKYEKRIKILERIAEEFQNSYQKTTELLKSQIGENGLAATANSLNTTLKYIEESNTEWMYGDEESFSTKLAYIIAQSEHGLVPDDYLINNGHNFENATWGVYYTNDVNSDSNDNCIYITLKLMQNWLKNKQQKDVSVVYCVPYEDSLNSYVVGYSNHRSFLITFLRNQEDICRFEWQEMVYETSYVGDSLLD
ncbi:MAG: hypothetical protein ACLVJI_07590 [Bacilli bacterium]